MKIVGIIGGLGPESTIEYYRLIIDTYRERKPDGSYPQIVINSVNLQRVVDLITAGAFAEVADLLAGEVRKLARAGADFAALSANTPHVVFDEINRASPIPLVSIVEATCEEAEAVGLKRLGLFGTRFTMQGRFYPEVFSRRGLQIVVPREDEQDFIHDKYMSELIKGVFLPETRERLLAIAARMNERDGIEGLILGGTELPLILRQGDGGALPFLDTTRIHVNAIVERLLT
ncbi:MAG: amino acid racemase [Acidobacteriota bacterium]|nr:amino acid racemase [Acidobacteriota bacterium]